MKYIVRNNNGHYLYRIKEANGWYYFTDNKDRAKLFTKEEANELIINHDWRAEKL